MGIKDKRASAQRELADIYGNITKMGLWRTGMLKEAYILVSQRDLSDAVGEDLTRIKDLKELLIHINTVSAAVSRDINTLNQQVLSRISEMSGLSIGYRSNVEEFMGLAAKKMAERYPEVTAADNASTTNLSTYRNLSYLISSLRTELEINALLESAPEKFV